MLSSTSDYALRAILVLAQASGGRPLRAEQIARATGSPANYLAKTLNALAKAGLVTSTRGPFGGFVLAVPASELTVARIIDCFDEHRPQIGRGRAGFEESDRLQYRNARAQKRR